MKIAGYDLKAVTVLKWSVAVLIFVVIAIFWGFLVAVAFGLFAVAFLLDIDPVVAFGIALVVLVVAALMVLLAQKEAAKILAMWSYCFLAVGVALQFYHYILSGEDKEDDAEE